MTHKFFIQLNLNGARDRDRTCDPCRVKARRATSPRVYSPVRIGLFATTHFGFNDLATPSINRLSRSRILPNTSKVEKRLKFSLDCTRAVRGDVYARSQHVKLRADEYRRSKDRWGHAGPKSQDEYPHVFPFGDKPSLFPVEPGRRMESL